MVIIKFKDGERVWRRTFPDRLSTECAGPDWHRVWRAGRLLRVCQRLVRRLEARGYFAESGFDHRTGGFWVIVGCGDNCLRIMP